MYVPAPPAPPVAGWDPAGISSVALGPALPGAGAVAATIAAATTSTTLHAHSSTLNVLEWHPVTVRGTLAARSAVSQLAGRLVSLQRLRGDHWRTVAAARTERRGKFRLRLIPHRLGSERLRVRFAGDAYLRAATRRLGRLNVYRSVEASWYGGGGALACGGSLTSGTMGVASRTLPCGSLVTLRFAGRTVCVPVVDRGPFVAGREFDLTEATKEALGFGDTGMLWSTS